MELFEGPIPGQSLTTPPKSMPYERPPEINDPEEALQMYLTRLNKPEVVEGLINALELDLDVVTLTEGLTRMGVSRGIHSVDVSLIISPVIHEFIVTIADEAGIEYDEGIEDKEEKRKGQEQLSKAKEAKLLQKALKEFKSRPMDSAPMDDLEEADFESEETVEPQKQGLMKRKNK